MASLDITLAVLVCIVAEESFSRRLHNCLEISLSAVVPLARNGFYPQFLVVLRRERGDFFF